MALIKCSECGKEFSDKAPACIHCGCPTEAAKKAPANGFDFDKLFEKMSDGKPGLNVDFHAQVTPDVKSTQHTVFVQELGRNVDFLVPVDTKVGQKIRVFVKDHPTYGFVIFNAVSVTMKNDPERAGVISVDRARELLNRYKPSLFARACACPIIPKFVAMFFVFAIGGRFTDMALDFEVMLPFIVISVILFFLHVYYPSHHFKRYLRKHKIHEAIRNDSGSDGSKLAISSFSKSIVPYFMLTFIFFQLHNLSQNLLLSLRAHLLAF